MGTNDVFIAIIFKANYFVTICTRDREHLFCGIENGETMLSEEGIVADKCWMGIPTHSPDVVLHEYVIMPNHIHGIIEIKKSMDVLDRDVRDNVDIHNNVDARDNVGAKNFSPLRLPDSYDCRIAGCHPGLRLDGWTFGQAP